MTTGAISTLVTFGALFFSLLHSKCSILAIRAVQVNTCFFSICGCLVCHGMPERAFIMIQIAVKGRFLGIYEATNTLRPFAHDRHSVCLSRNA